MCAQVGANVSTTLRTAMMELCDRRHGQLSKLEIDHVFDVVMNSVELFSVYQQGYTTCVGLKNSPQFAHIDESTVTHFVVGAYCRDVIRTVFHEQIETAGPDWKHGFIEGFAAFLSEHVDHDMPRRLYHAYQKLATQFGGNLTPVTILNSEEVVRTMSEASVRLKTLLGDDPAVLGRLEAAINHALDHMRTFDQPARDHVDKNASLTFLEHLYASASETNPFRSLVAESALAA